MNDVKHMIRSKLTNFSGKLRPDKNIENDSLTLPPYADILYTSSKNDKEVYNELYKKMSSICVQNYTVTDDKKMKKNIWESLLNVLIESEKKLSEDNLTKEIMSNSVKVLEEMAHTTKEFEKMLSTNVIKHFQDLSDDNVLTITKKSLTSLSKDMRANIERVHSLQDQLSSPTNDTSNRKTAEILTENKLMTAQIVEENTEKEWENKKDLYLSKLFATESERFITAEKYLKFFQDYLAYYVDCQKILTKFIPEIKSTLDKNRHIYAFHVPLEDHLTATNRKLSYVLETCIQELDNEDTLQHEGLFRISGGRSKMELLKNALNVMRIDDFITKGFDSSVYAGVLKQYLRELPIPLMTFDLYEKWCDIGAKIRQNDIDGIMPLVKDCLSLMPSSYYDNLAYLMQFLRKITEYEPINKMSASNLGLMLGPNLIRCNHGPDNEDNESSAMLILGSPGCSVLEFLIVHYDDLFPDAPVYPTASKRLIRSMEVSPSDNDQDKNVRNVKQMNDNDSLSSTDLLTDDSVSTTEAESNDSQPSNQSVTSPRIVDKEVTTVESSYSPRRLGSPPPPPQTKPYQVNNNDKDIVPATCPTIMKRASQLVKHISDPIVSKDHLESSLTGETGPRRTTSVLVVPRPNHLPPVPAKKPLQTPERPPSRPDNPPPRRPHNPPAPVRPFSKVKDILVEVRPCPDDNGGIDGPCDSIDNEV